MSRRTLTSFLWTAAVVAVLGLAARSQAAPQPKDDAGTGSEELVPMAVAAQPVALPLIARLAPVQRRHFASLLLYGVHPLLTLVPTDRLVDLPCDHPGCAAVEQPSGEIVIGIGVNDNAGIKCEIVPLPKDVHGSIEIGFGFSLNGAPTYKFLVTEYWGCGNCRKDKTFRGCVETFARALLSELCTGPEPSKGTAEESSADLREATPAQKSCEPGVAVMVDGLTKACYLSLAVGRVAHAQDLAAQAFALDPNRVKGDPVVFTLYQSQHRQPQCDECPDCPDCPGCNYQKATAKPYRETTDAPAGVGKGD